MSYYKDHGWRGDEYTLIRGDMHGSVSRAWCAETECTTAWRWSAYRINDAGSVNMIEAPVTVKRHGFPTKGEAMLACERFLSSQAEDEQCRRWASFEGMEPAPEAF